MGGKSARLAALLGEEQDEEQPSAAGPSPRLQALLGGDSEAPQVNAGAEDVDQLASVMQPEEAKAILSTDKGQQITRMLGDLLAAKDRDPTAIYKAMSERDNALNGGLSPVDRAARAAVATYSPGGDAIAGGALYGAAEGFDDSKKAEVLGKLLDGVRGGAGGAAGAYVGGKLADMGGAALSGVGDWLTAQGARARNAIVGSAAAARDAIDQYGSDALPGMLGDLLQKYSPTTVLRPKGAAGHLKTIEGQLSNEGIHNRALIQAAGEEGVDAAMPSIYGNVQQRVGQLAGEAAQRPLGQEARNYASALRGVADDLGAAPPPATFAGGVSDKASLQAQGNTKLMGGLSDAAAGRAAGEAGRVYRDELSQGVQQYADPRTAGDYLTSNRTYADLATLNDLLKARAAAEQGAGGLGTVAASAALGAGIGGITGAVTGDDPLKGAAIGAGGMFAANLGLTGGATQTAIRQIMGSAGADMGANLLQGAGRGLASAGGFSSSMSPLASGAGRVIGTEVGELAGGTRGHESTATIEQLLQQNPQALGKWASDLQEAQQNGELTEKIGRLTDDDQDFRALLRTLQNEGR